jgi:hypothetical protein
VEKHLVTWIYEKETCRDIVSHAFIIGKAKKTGKLKEEEMQNLNPN